MGIFVLNRLSFPTRKTGAPFGAEAGGDGVGSGPDYLTVSQLLGITSRMWRPFRLAHAGLRPSTNGLPWLGVGWGWCWQGASRLPVGPPPLTLCLGFSHLSWRQWWILAGTRQESAAPLVGGGRRTRSAAVPLCQGRTGVVIQRGVPVVVRPEHVNRSVRLDYDFSLMIR